MPILAHCSEIHPSHPIQPVAPLCCIYLRCFIQVNGHNQQSTYIPVRFCCLLPRRKANQNSAVCYFAAKQIKFCCLLPCTGSKTSVKFIAADSHKTTFSLYVCASSIFFDCYSVMSDSEESLLRKTGVEFEVPGFDDSGSVSRNGVFNNNIC